MKLFEKIERKKMKIGETLNKIRKEKGMTVNSLAKRAGVHKRTISNIISGKTQNPGIVTLTKLCQALGVTLEDLFTYDSQI